MELYNDNCFNIFPKIGDKTINLFVLDLPYANFKFGKCTACKWDLPIDLDKMWIEIKRIMKPNAVIVFFCNTKFGYALIDSNPKYFKYDLIWKKSRKVGFLSANKQPLRQHENIYVFNDKKATYNPQKTEGKPYIRDRNGHNKEKYCYGEIERGNEIKENKGDRHPTSILPNMELEEHEMVYVFDNPVNEEYNINDLELNRNLDLRAYAEKVFKFIGKTKKELIKDIGQKIDHFFRFKSSQFALPIIETYNELIEKYKINEMEGFIEYDILKDSWEKHPLQNPKTPSTYNPQKTEGKAYKNGAIPNDNNIYGTKREKEKITKTDRHPSSILPDDLKSTILEYNNPHKTIHRTQKPEKLLEWLIKTYSNEEDTVMDFCMGSGTAGVACINTNRKFIGVEMNKEIFELAKKRIDEIEVI